VGSTLVISGRDMVLFAIPSALLLLFSVFGLDQIIAAPKVPLSRRRPACGLDKHGEPILRDPDGRLSLSGNKGNLRSRMERNNDPASGVPARKKGS
jgi:hypothetical protein